MGRLDWQAAARLLDPPRPVPARPHGQATGDLGKLAAWVAAQREGNRNDGLFWAACRAAEPATATWASSWPPRSRRGSRRTPRGARASAARTVAAA